MTSNEPSVPLQQTLVVVNQFIVETAKFLNKFASNAERKLDEVGTHIHKLEKKVRILESKLERIPQLKSLVESNPMPVRGKKRPFPILPPLCSTVLCSLVTGTTSTATPAAAAPAPAPGPGPAGAPAPPGPPTSNGLPPPPGPPTASTPAGLPTPQGLPPPPAAGAPPVPGPPQQGAAEGEAKQADNQTEGGETEEAAAPAEPEVPVLKAKDDPKLFKFFKSLQIGVPRPQIEFNMRNLGLDPSVLE